MTKIEALRVRVTPAEHAALRGVADERSCSVSAVVRWAVHQMLANEIAQAERSTSAVSAQSPTQEAVRA